MLKLIFDKDVSFSLEKIIISSKVETLSKNGALHSDLMIVNIEQYKSKKCVPY